MLGFKKKIIKSKLKFSLKFKTQHSKDFSKKKYGRFSAELRLKRSFR